MAVIACSESPFEPQGKGERVPIGSVIEDRVSADSINWYSFEASPDQPLVVFLNAVQGQVVMAVYDSTNNLFITTLNAIAGGQPLDENPSDPFGSINGGIYRLSVRALPPGGADFRFKVYAINVVPELVAASFALGDTVTGETIDPMVDIDRFVVHGDSGQEIVGVGETPGPPGSGSVSLTVIDPVANQLLGYVFADAGTATPLTTGRIRLPATRDYRFSFSSVISNVYPRYRGPYRFWTYVINRAPEHRAAAIPFNTEIRNERIDRAGDVDEFTFQAAAGSDYNAFVQGGGRTFQLDVAPQGGQTFAIVTSQPSDTGLFTHATNRFQISNPGAYVMRVTGTKPNEVADTGAYRVYLYAIDRRPEHVAAAITPGDTVTGEAIDLPGDIDEFTFTSAAGDEFNAFLQAQNGSLDAHLQLGVLNGAGAVLRTAVSAGTDTSLLRQPTGRFALPGTGTYRLRVTSQESYGGEQYRGPYRLFLYRVNRRPEVVPDTLAFGDSLSGEAIDVPGDLDEFRVTVPDTSGANLVLAFDGQSANYTSLVARLVDSTTGKVLAEAATNQTATRVASGRIRLASGKYLIRVDATDYYQDQSVLRGQYRLWLYRFGFGPEAVRDTFAIGDTVSGESIEPWGDEDKFYFYGVRNQHINIMAQGLAAPSDGGFLFFVTPPGANAYGVLISSGTAAGALEDHQSARMDLPATGWYTVDVSGGSGMSSRGPYRFTVLPVDPRPEHVSAMLSVGDSVTTEPIDAPGDLDEFTVTATPGQEVSLIVDGRDGFTGPFVNVWVFDPATLDTLASQVGQFHRIAGPFRVPASGQFKIDVSQPRGLSGNCYDATCGGVFSFVGSYGFHVIAVNRAPENVPAAFAVGDTVRGESISPAGDIDEFTSSGTPGEQLTLFDRLTVPSAPFNFDSALVLEVIDPATGRSLVGGNAAILGSNTFYAVGSFTVPPSGSFIVRAHVYGEQGYGVGETAPYEFFVKRGP